MERKQKKHWLIKTIPKLIPDVLALAGTAAITYGAWCIYRPAGWIVGGALLIAGAVVVSYGKGGDDA